MTAVGEPIQGGPGEPLTPQDLGPMFKRQVGSDNETVAFVGGADDVEDQALRSCSCRQDTPAAESGSGESLSCDHASGS